MRFHGMLHGDRVQISPSGKAWRPPDYITAPTKHSPQNTLTSFRTTKPPSSLAPLSKGRFRQNHRIPLPLPPTCIPHSPPPRILRRFGPKILAFCAAILVACSILACLTRRLSDKLDQVARTVEQTNVHSHAFSKPGEKPHQHSSRNLLSIRAISSPHAVPTVIPETAIFSTISSFYTAAVDIHRIMHVLLGRKYKPFTASILQNAPKMTGLGEKRLLEVKLDTLQKQILESYREIANKQTHAPLQTPQQGRDVKHPWQYKEPSEKGEPNFRVDVKKTASRELELPRDAQVHTTNVANVVSAVDLSGAAYRMGKAHVIGAGMGTKHLVPPMAQPSDTRPGGGSPYASSSILLQYPDLYPRNMDGRKKTKQKPQAFKLSHNRTEDLPDAVEMWQLPGGKWVCRIFNVGYLPDRTLILPKWMKKHVSILDSRCGVTNAFYVGERVNGKKPMQIDTKELKAKGISNFKVNTAYVGRDMFGTWAPRNHMPHFVTDIFFHLVACEALLGSGKNLLQSSTLLPPGPSGVEVRSVPTFPHLHPSLFLLDETWIRPPSGWVPRLAQFFRHPKIGFTFIPAVKEKKGKDGVDIMNFRSMVVGNFNNHEPYGLFGANGTNIVFEANGITREPAWNTRGMQEQPCRIIVTVLTRTGPRALLSLKELRVRIERLGKRAGILTDYHIVDFGEMSFDEQVEIMQETNVLIATHGAGNANFIFMRPSSAVIEVFPFAYKAGPFNRFAAIFGLDYKFAMSAPQTDVFKECMNRHETSQAVKKLVFSWWDKAVKEEKMHPWVHRLELEKEFGDPGKSEGMTTRGCIRLQELEFNLDAVSRMVADLGSAQCTVSKAWSGYAYPTPPVSVVSSFQRTAALP